MYPFIIAVVYKVMNQPTEFQYHLHNKNEENM